MGTKWVFLGEKKFRSDSATWPSHHQPPTLSPSPYSLSLSYLSVSTYHFCRRNSSKARRHWPPPSTNFSLTQNHTHYLSSPYHTHTLSRQSLRPLSNHRRHSFVGEHVLEKGAQEVPIGQKAAPWRPTRGGGNACNMCGQAVAYQRCTAVSGLPPPSVQSPS